MSVTAEYENEGAASRVALAVVAGSPAKEPGGLAPAAGAVDFGFWEAQPANNAATASRETRC